MEDEPKAAKPKRKLGPIVLLIAGLVVLVLVLVNFTGPRGDLRALDRMGVPLSASAVEKMQPSQGDNAAPIYLQLEEELAERSLLARQRTRFGRLVEMQEFSRHEIDTDQREAILEASQKMQPFVERYRVAAAMPRCVPDPPEDFENPDVAKFRFKLTGYEDFFRPAHALCEIANTEMMRGHISESMHDLELAKNVGTQFSRNPSSVSLTAWAGYSSTFHANWLNCMIANRDNRAIVEGGAKLVQPPFVMADIRAAVAGDFPEALRIYGEAKKDPFHYKVYNRSRADEDINDNTILMRQAVNQTIHEWRVAFESMPKDSHDWQGFVSAFDKGSAAVRERWPANELISDPFINYSRLSRLWATVLAKNRLAYVASNLLQYRLDHKTSPDTLPDYGENSNDPFTGLPFHYERFGTGFRIYSVGSDRVDNVQNPPIKRGINDDIVYDFGD